MVYFQQPENALKRAEELIDVDKKASALEALSDVISSKRHRTWNKTLEQILLKYLEICVDLRKGKTAKDGLHQYKNICQQISVGSLETVIRHFVKLSEDRAEKARSQASAVVLDVDDLEYSETPESLIMAAVSGEDYKDRTDRVLLTPWLKFLWETYRTVLEILRNNAKLETLYQETSKRAFEFCLKYQRKTEFRRLCELLRNHLQNTIKYSSQPNSINLSNPESMQMHLESRFFQLNAASTLELWQEAFRSIEDIHGLIVLSKKSLKMSMMANYYQKLSIIFLKSDNFLYHAATCHRLFMLYKENEGLVSEAEYKEMADRAVLSTLAIPFAATNKNDVLTQANNRDQHLPLLLNMTSVPTREELVRDCEQNGVLSVCGDLYRVIYDGLEVKFDPLRLCKKMIPVFDVVKSTEDLQCFLAPLQESVICKLVLQLSQIYKTLKITYITNMASFASAFQIEKFIADAVRNKILCARINHKTSSIIFGDDNVFGEDLNASLRASSEPTRVVAGQLSRFSSVLTRCIGMLQADGTEQKQARKRDAIMKCKSCVEAEHVDLLKRKKVIEDRKVQIEEMIMQKEQEQAELRAIQKQMEAEAERERLLEEEQKREAERVKKEREEIERMQAMEKVEQMKKTIGGANAKLFADLDELKDMDPDQIIAKQVKQIDKEKKELNARLKSLERKLDHMERAIRVVEIPKRKEQWEEQRVENKVYWEQQQQLRKERLRKKHEEDLKIKNKLKRVQEFKNGYMDHLKEMRSKEFEQAVSEFDARYDELLKSRREEIKILRQKEKEMEEERERERAEQEERSRRRAEEEEIRARERLEEQARKAAEYEEGEAKRKIMLEKQQAKEREIEERLAAERAGDDGGKWERVTSSEWRSRERDNRSTSPRPAGRPGAYVPPSRRAGADREERGGRGGFSRDRDFRRDDRDRDFRRDDRDRDFRRDDRDRDFRRDDRGRGGFGRDDRGRGGFGRDDRDSGYERRGRDDSRREDDRESRYERRGRDEPPRRGRQEGRSDERSWR
eukprot:Nk52_evm18s2612 gene=Nk52_evmTU18s2612